jgi:hypothetical protein
MLITMFCKMTLEVKLETTNNLSDKILSANSFAKSSSMVDINLHDHHL